MKASPAGAVPLRKDRPHVYLKQERISCAKCGSAVEARTVLRGGEVFRLRHCPTCGRSEERVATDARLYLDDFLAQGKSDGEARLFKHTTAACTTCLALVDAKVMLRGGKVFFEKSCAKCGPSQALVSEDASWYVQAYSYSRAGSQPLKVATKPK